MRRATAFNSVTHVTLPVVGDGHNGDGDLALVGNAGHHSSVARYEREDMRAVASLNGGSEGRKRDVRGNQSGVDDQGVCAHALPFVERGWVSFGEPRLLCALLSLLLKEQDSARVGRSVELHAECVD